MSRDLGNVSVLLPTHKFTPDLVTAVVSTLADMRPDDELLLVLDGHQNSVEFATLPNDPRIRLLPHRPGGCLASALNYGLSAASNEFVARMDGDDVVVPGRFTAQHKFLAENPEVVLVGGQIEYIDDQGAPAGALKLPVGSDLRKALLGRNVCAHPSIMFRRSVLLEIGGYDSSLKFSEDYEMYLRIARCGPIANLSRVVLSYRIHSAQMSNRDRAFSRHTRIILSGRNDLAAFLGETPWRQKVRNLTWFAAQLLRNAGFRGR